MNLLIHDLSAAEWARVADNYQDWTVVADTGGIRPCRGCFYCWSSGTGVCAVKDGYEKMGQQCKVYAVVNNGLYESRQNENLLSAIKDWCAESGSKYCGALAIGAGEVAGVLMRGKKWTLWPVRNVKKGLRHLAKTIDAGIETIDAFADPFVFPRWLYIWIANTSWRMKKKSSKARK